MNHTPPLDPHRMIFVFADARRAMVRRIAELEATESLRAARIVELEHAMQLIAECSPSGTAAAKHMHGIATVMLSKVQA